MCGPLSVASYGGCTYFVTFIDDFSRKVFVYVLKSKSEVFGKFVEFKIYAENQTGKQIKVIRTDNGTEYLNKQFMELCKKNGIKHEKSTAYSPQQNGISERMNRTLTEKMRCMLFEGKCEKRLWGEALLAAANIINILPNSANENRSPDEVWNGKKPDISKFKLFGCKALALIPKQKRKKLDEKTLETIYLRPADDVKAYRLYDKCNRRIIVSRDVTFFEDQMMNEGGKIETFIHDIDDSDNGDNEETDNGDNEETAPVEENEIEENLNNVSRIDGTESTIDENFESPDNSILDPNYVPDENIDASNIGDDRVATRSKTRYDMLNLHVAFHVEPESYDEAMQSIDKGKWKDAMREEYDSLMNNNTWELVPRPHNENIVDNKWIFKIKINPDGSIERYKARLVARGFTQEYGTSYNETFSPVVKFTSIRTILAIAANDKMLLGQFDVKTAFLNGELDEVVYMKQPIGFSDNTNRVCKLRKSLYGLKQASRCWNKKFRGVIERIGFMTCQTDQCVFIRRINNKVIIIALHVDDGLVAANDDGDIDMVAKLLSRHFEMKIMNVGCFLGVEIEQGSDGSIFIHQEAYTERILQKYGMQNVGSVGVPADPNQPLHKFDETDDSTYPYREVVGSLMYLAVGTRPDIAYAVGVVSRFLEHPKLVHERAVKRILKYLSGTIDFGLLYIHSNNANVIGYSDADYAGDIDTRKSTTGYCFMFANALISWKSAKQKSGSLSTTESEYMAASDAIKEWLVQGIFERNYMC